MWEISRCCEQHQPGHCLLTPARCAAQVGGVIGKAGVIVKQVRDETGARIRVVEGLPSSEERVIVISAPNMAGQPTHAAQVRISVLGAEQAESLACAGCRMQVVETDQDTTHPNGTPCYRTCRMPSTACYSKACLEMGSVIPSAILTTVAAASPCL